MSESNNCSEHIKWGETLYSGVISVILLFSTQNHVPQIITVMSSVICERLIIN